MTNKPLFFLGIFFVAIGIAKLGYVLVMKAKDNRTKKSHSPTRITVQRKASDELHHF